MDDPNIQVTGEAAGPISQDGGEESDVVIWAPSSSLAQDLLVSEIADYMERKTAALLLIHDEPKVIEILSKLKLPAWGLLSTELSQVELISAVNALNEGLVVINPTGVQYISSTRAFISEENSEMVEPLTGREMEILQLLALGLTNKQIALRLGISAHTVKFHLSSIFNKMGTTNRTETVKLGLRMGYITL
jgi:NarL family two-component system response regulator YdfI